MACLQFPGGIVCVSRETVDLTPYGSAVMVEMHAYCGPRFTTKQGREIRKPSRRTWAACEEWRKEATK